MTQPRSLGHLLESPTALSRPAAQPASTSSPTLADGDVPAVVLRGAFTRPTTRLGLMLLL